MNFLCFFSFFKAKKLEENRAWFVETVSRFKPPNEKSKEALNSQIVKLGDHHQLSIKPELKEQALKISPYLVSFSVLLVANLYFERQLQF